MCVFMYILAIGCQNPPSHNLAMNRKVLVECKWAQNIMTLEGDLKALGILGSENT